MHIHTCFDKCIIVGECLFGSLFDFYLRNVEEFLTSQNIDDGDSLHCTADG